MTNYGPPLRVTDPLTGIEYDSNGEAWRFICECRGWLRRGYTTSFAVERLRKSLAERPANRAPESIDRLIAGMREQYRIMRRAAQPVDNRGAQ